MKAPEELTERVVLSTSASGVPLKVEDTSIARVIAEAFKPHARRPKVGNVCRDAA